MDSRLRRLGVFAACSVVAILLAVGDALRTHRQFYPAAISLAQSRLFALLLCNAFGIIVFSVYLLVKICCFGVLRSQERAAGMEHLRSHVTECLLAIAMFPAGRTMPAVAHLIVTVAGKTLHCVAAQRLDFVSGLSSEPLRRNQRPRIAVLLGGLLLGDLLFSAHHGWHSTGEEASGVTLLLLQDCLLMTISAVVTILRFNVCSTVPGSAEWSAGRSRTLIVGAGALALESVIHAVFFAVVWFRFGFPIHLMRGTLTAVRELRRAADQVRRHRRLGVCFEACIADADPAEAERAGHCPICFDQLAAGGAKRLRCGHLFHKHCLRQWIERQPVCPYCRERVALGEEAEGLQDAQLPAAPPAAPSAAGTPQARADPAAVGAFAAQQEEGAALRKCPASPAPGPRAAPPPPRLQPAAAPAAGAPPAAPPSVDEVQIAYREYLAQWDGQGQLRVAAAASVAGGAALGQPRPAALR